MSQGKDLNQENGRPTDELQDWDSQLKERANAYIHRQMEPLKAEIESFQLTITEISSRLIEKAQAPPNERDTSDLIAFVKLWLREVEAKNERDFQAKLEEECEKAASAARQESEQDFGLRLEDARLEWEIANQQAGELEFQRRLEQACGEATAVARREAELQIGELHEQLEASRKALTLAVAAAQEASAQRAMFDSIKIAVDDLDAQRTQSETLSSLVYNIAQFAPRVVFFVMKGGNAVGWKAFGFENGLNDETVRLLSVPTANSSLLSDALTTFSTVTGRSNSSGDNSSLLGSYGLPVAERAIAVPLVVRGKAAAVLYADSGAQAESAINIPAIETLMRVASMGIELLPARRGLEPPRPPIQAAPKRAAASAPLSSARTGGLSEKSSPQSVQEPPVEKERIPAVEVKFDQPAEQSYSADRLAPPEPVFEGRHTGDLVMPPGVAERFKMDDLAPEPAPKESLKEEFPSSTSGIGDVMRMDAWPSIQKRGQRQTQDLAERAESMKMAFQMLEEKVESVPSQKSSPLAPPEPLTAPKVVTQGPSSETEQRAHNDARRFARLLVSEIKLYNATKVNDGRRNFDLYPRLKDEIDRSRKVYDKRVAPAVAGRFDYFYDELVQTLAEGDPEKLGPDCPGPLVIAS
ncbi:MAG: hypothetical protein L0220_09475 [Acidobacteria bacterium]|nr:hypothetical protein [Acidobacteriota bacterium]